METDCLKVHLRIWKSWKAKRFNTFVIGIKIGSSLDVVNMTDIKIMNVKMKEKTLSEMSEKFSIKSTVEVDGFEVERIEADLMSLIGE